MTGQRKYWKSYAKSNLKGNWGIAIAAMLAVVAVNFIGNIFAVQLFPGDSVFALVLSEIFVFIVSLIGMNDLQYRIQLYAAEYLQRQGLQPE